MEYSEKNSLLLQGEFVSRTVYAPKKHPGFTAWATAFSYGDGTVGLSFDEALEAENPDYYPVRLEFAEAAGIPVSYGSVESVCVDRRSFRVYLRSSDGLHFEETGRCARREGSLCNIGFPDGRLIGFDVPRTNEKGTGWSDFIRVRESLDGGNTWHDIRTLLNGTAPYLWRVRRLRCGTILVLASLYGTPWGQGCLRSTRNTMLPGESSESKVQPFFLTSEDGIHFSGPNYILPGIGAHEYDFAELPDGRLLFIAGDVQGTPVGRQFVRRTKDGWINGSLLPIYEGAPECPQKNPQGGYVPETLVWDEVSSCVVGYRRNRGFSISNDFGENWTQFVPEVPAKPLYQPFLIQLSDGRLALYGHVGGDNAFGECDMTIEAQVFSAQSARHLPHAPMLSLERMQDAEKTHYINAFRARLTENGKPLAGCRVEFRFRVFWNDDGSVNMLPQELAPDRVTVCTDENGYAQACAARYDGVADIHLAYTADVICPPADNLRACQGPMMTVLALTPHRKKRYPYDAYFAGGILYLAPQLIQEYPQEVQQLCREAAQTGDPDPQRLCQTLRSRLAACGVLKSGPDSRLHWISSVHAPCLVADVRVMPDGDWYL